MKWAEVFLILFSIKSVHLHLGLLKLFHKMLLELIEKLIDLRAFYRITQQIVELDQLGEKEKGQYNGKNA